MIKIVIWFLKKRLTWTQFRTLKIKNQSSKELTNFILKSINHSHQAYILTIYVKSPDKWKLHVRCFHSINSVHHKNRKTTSTKTGHLLRKSVCCSCLITNSWVATLSIDAQHFFYFRILLINFFIYWVEDSLKKMLNHIAKEKHLKSG